jgi:hypothetical protein
MVEESDSESRKARARERLAREKKEKATEKSNGTGIFCSPPYNITYNQRVCLILINKRSRIRRKEKCLAGPALPAFFFGLFIGVDFLSASKCSLELWNRRRERKMCYWVDHIMRLMRPSIRLARATVSLAHFHKLKSSFMLVSLFFLQLTNYFFGLFGFLLFFSLLGAFSATHSKFGSISSKIVFLRSTLCGS